MEQFLVKQVKGKDIKDGDVIWAREKWNKVKGGVNITDCGETFLVKLPSPDILLPSEELIDEASFDTVMCVHDAFIFVDGANWALSRLKELNPKINFKIKQL